MESTTIVQHVPLLGFKIRENGEFSILGSPNREQTVVIGKILELLDILELSTTDSIDLRAYNLTPNAAYAKCRWSKGGRLVVTGLCSELPPRCKVFAATVGDAMGKTKTWYCETALLPSIPKSRVIDKDKNQPA